jgi:PAS domain S-box-containing protein
MRFKPVLLVLILMIFISISLSSDNEPGSSASDLAIEQTSSLHHDLQPNEILFLKNQNSWLLKLLIISLVLLVILWFFSFYLVRIKGNWKYREQLKKSKETEAELKSLLKIHEEKLSRQKIEYDLSKAELYKSRKRYQNLVDELHEGMVIVDKDERIQFVNKTGQKIYGRSEKELVGHCVGEFTDSLEFNEILNQTELRKNGTSSKYESIVYRPNGERRIVKISASPIFENKKYQGSVGVFIDVTDQKRNETFQELIFNISNAVNTSTDMDELYKKIHKDLGVVIDTTNFYIALYDKKTNMISAPYYVDVIKKEKPKPQMMGNGLTAYVIHTGKSLYLTVEKRDQLVREGKIGAADWKSKIWLGVPLKIQDEVIGALAVQSYISADTFSQKDLWILEFVSDQIAIAISKKRAEQALTDSEQFNRAIIENSPLAISARDNKGRLLVANKAWMKIWNKSEADLEDDYRAREQFQFNERDDYLEEYRNNIREIYQNGGEIYISELRIGKRQPSAVKKWISQYFYALKSEKSEVDKVIIITEDITQRKISEEKIKASLIEKEILLKEVHHRVKNNMQVISSMLNLQSNYIKDTKALSLFKDSQNRVKSMALIHEKLYQSKNFDQIDFEQYITVLINYLFRSFNVAGNQIKTQIDSEAVMLDITKAIPCGLILNELVSNSLKHAFPNNREGNIHLEFKKVNSNFEIRYEDDGIGLPPDFDFRNTDSLGMQIVNALVKQLHGDITFVVDQGTEFRLKFPEKTEI